ncbi:amidase [Lutimaribacter sp. EGI FJ00015]|uniref:Amidase n=1 Tax=Lutimaribacter degradans TaxID=2945989 RepID=A0ACC5ZUN9_9RHOB|nr:amidase [Lutimaribacter sp. EGI FJ00013]MCM2561104.1 amidase [Lutimaribacter sp. EGI FJ00013]MCO0611947.1 amidase [Lutimaribacter sp. EGI FJ00015]MCO0634932.1 amidase [Lutimaribacter sp. EGI FJ00014]
MELTDRPALELSAMLERREISAVELMQATLDRIGVVNGTVNAVISLGDSDALLQAARAADDSPRAGWLHGIPMAVKDLANVAGYPTSFGSPAMPETPAKADDLMVGRLRAAGAVFIGKTNTPEFGLGSHTFNPVHGTTLNPYDLGRSAGGSSGGAAVALAARMLSVADGSDMMGSLRNPAGWANVYGMRPSWGRIPGEPQGEMFLHPLATTGPMARNPRDLAALLEVQAGPDPRQPFGLPRESYLDAIAADVKGRRIGWLADWGGAYEMEPGILELTESALRVFEELGAVVEPVSAPIEAAEIWDSWLGLRAFANAGRLDPLYQNPVTRDRLKPDAIWEIETGRALGATEIQRLSLIRSDWFRRAAALFDKYDALVLPSAQVWPFPADWERPHRINDTEMDTYHRWMEVVVPVSLIGLPCVNLPAGFGANGLPGGMQLFGRHGNDLGLLQLAEAYHQAIDWPGKNPPDLS